MRLPKFLRKKNHIAVIGLYQSGKTVFITSIINHMKNHRPSDLKLGDGNVKITFDEELSPYKGMERFPYEEYRADNNGKWPRKTKTLSQYRCGFFVRNWKLTKGELGLVDIPGERLADLPMAKFSFSQWSDWLLEKAFRDKHYRSYAKEYLELIEKDDLVIDEILFAYRKLLASLYKSFRPIITPSTFLIQQDGGSNGAKIYRDNIEGCFSGLTNDEQFAPLPEKIRKKNKNITSQFSARYKKYRSRIVKPLHKNLSHCNKLAVLIDVTTILATNTGMFNGNRALLEKLFSSLSPGKGLVTTILGGMKDKLSLGRLKSKGITKVAIVITKADKVHDSQIDKLTFLGKDIAQDIVDKYEQSTQLTCKYFPVAAVKSTTSQSDGSLLGTRVDTHQYGEYKSSDIPKEWPEKWDEKSYNFPDVEPEFPENISKAPNHLGMHHLMNFFLDLNTRKNS